jgi:hypothetical protein
MKQNKTLPTGNSVLDFIEKVENEDRKKDAYRLLDIMQELSGKEPVLWGPSIIGFDSYHYKYDTGREGDMCLVGFSPRKDKLSVYIMPGFHHFEEELSALGPHKLGKACLYIKTLSTINETVLRQIIQKSIDLMRKKYH